jgi:predicted ABC-type exoprotein transport system permease subunit
MMKLATWIATAIIANAVGLLLAALLLDGFRIDVWSFVIVLLVFTVIMLVTAPLLAKITDSSLPQIKGGIALISVFFGLKATDLLMAGFEIGILANWLAATLLVWLGSLTAEVVLPMVFKASAPATT